MTASDAILTKRRSRSRRLILDYKDSLRLLRTRWSKAFAVGLVGVWLLLPFGVGDVELNILSYCGVAAIGATGLNLIIGYTGQVSLGHGFFIGVGAYVCVWFGSHLGWPIVLWLPLAAVVGGLCGAIIGPLALRLRGNYLLIVTLGVVIVGGYGFKSWTALSGGENGTTTAGALPAIDTQTFELLGTSLTRDQGLFWLVWAVTSFAVLAARNIVHGRPGRALQAVRDRDLAAEVVGVSVARYKIAAFVVSSAYAALAGALYALLQGFVSPLDFGLLLSIQYIAIIIIGGVGTIIGPVLGAVVLGALPRIIEQVSQARDLPLIAGDKGGSAGFLDIGSLNALIYGVLIIAFLLMQPRGLAAAWQRVRTRVEAWPLAR